MALEEQYDKIYKYCYFHVHSRTLAEDLTQETFLRYLGRTEEVCCGEAEGHRSDIRERNGSRRSNSLLGEKQLAYLYTIARNLCADHFRKSGREVLGFGETDVEEMLDEKAGSGDGQLWGDRISGNGGLSLDQLALRQAVLSLPEDMRELVWLRFVQEEPAVVAAEFLGISRFAVYRREKQALALLRKHLEE